jgi:hypothetical protein
MTRCDSGVTAGVMGHVKPALHPECHAESGIVGLIFH